MKTAEKLTFVVEDDPFLRLVAVVLDPDVPSERLQAFADFCAHDEPDFTGWLARVRTRVGSLYPARVVLASADEVMLAVLPEADALIIEGTKLDAGTLARAIRLRLVQKFGTLTGNIDGPACAGRQVKVRTLRRRANMACADFTMGLLIALARKICELDGLVTEERLRKAGHAPRAFDRRHTANSNAARVGGIRQLGGATLGIVGLGEIGRETALRARASGMQIVYTKRTPLSTAEEAHYGARYRPLDDLLGESDFVCVHLPPDASTRGILNAARLECMKPGAMLINAARPEFVDRAALIAALSSGHLGGYAGDMPYEPESEGLAQLLGLPNVILTPHIGAAPRMNALDDIEAMLAGIADELGRTG